eukprot:TRINITY_DN6549_c0_g1_i1.p1 TRINITY_DN6549_c0_g1~~TRINITY_DN6549_c0_g1_i1.p1  ORF type:complete len:309 (+),score=73.89 TRINITY_DN6549_c0_g1_i1:190-1116(+)
MDAWHATGATTNDGAQLFVQHIVDRKTLVILVTDFKQLWLEDLTDLELEKRSQECNPHVQFKTGKLLATISTALSTSQDNSTLVIDQTEDKNEMNIEASTRTLGGKLKFVFESKCSLQSPSKFYFYVTRPLLAIAASAAQAPVIGGLNTDGLSVDWCSPEPSAAVLHNPTFQSNLQAVTAALLNRNPSHDIATAWSPPPDPSQDTSMSVGLLDSFAANDDAPIDVYNQATLDTIDTTTTASTRTSPLKAPAPVSDGDADVSTQEGGKRTAFGKAVAHQQDLNDSIEGKELLKQAVQPPAKRKKKKKKL